MRIFYGQYWGKILIEILLFFIPFALFAQNNGSVVLSKSLYARLKGRIILKVEGNGEAYYVSPKEEKLYYLGRPGDALALMRQLGIGIKNVDLDKIPIGITKGDSDDTDGDGIADNLESAIGTNPKDKDTDRDGFEDGVELQKNNSPFKARLQLPIDLVFTRRQLGKILLQVEGRGEAWYVNPKDERRYFLGKPSDAYKLMRALGLGVSNKDFSSLTTSAVPFTKEEQEIIAIRTIVATSTPLIIDDHERGYALTYAGVIKWTNTERIQNSAYDGFIENTLLNQAAILKLQDMFAKQYFAHVSPQGEGTGEFVQKVGYDFMAVGENIALGNFADDEELVKAWMASPGHRANILDGKYAEIGVAVQEGTFEGRKTWIGVQVFGLPRSACPTVDESLKAEVGALSLAMRERNDLATAKKAEIDALPKQTQSDADIYNAKVDEYNMIVSEINTLLAKQKGLVNEYNAQVRGVNACVSAV